MRIDRLDLSRYGKFTDRSIALPAATRDFHLLVGANEAGKSTVRNAILDLLFGIEMRSAYDFLHPKAEMRLGALISDAGKTFGFQRVKKAKSLMDAHGAALPENALAAFLGNADRAFYDQMFGLDHGRLIAGGNEILKASNDVGRILFQSAAGIASLGHVRDALEAEADKLWARRRSGERAYYVAADALAAADASLKATTMRTRAWTDASTNIETLEAELEARRLDFRARESERVRLERIRRVAAAVRAFKDRSAELAALGALPELPADALQIYAEAEAAAVAAESQADLTRRLAAEARSALATKNVDEAPLRHAPAIEDLAARVQQTRSHALDIEKRQIEIDGHRASIADLVRQLGWGDTGTLASAHLEHGLESRLPPVPVRFAIHDLIKRHGAIQQSVLAADAAARAKTRDLDAIAAQLAGAALIEAPPELRAALAEAQQLGDLKAMRKRDESKLAKARQTLDAALLQLGAWRLSPHQLRALTLPPPELPRQLRTEQEQLKGDRRNHATRKVELELSIASLELEIAQLRTQHQAVTRDEIVRARGERDDVWARLRRGDRPVEAAADEYERRVRDADALADLRHDKAQEAASLQGKIEQREQRRLQLDHHSARLATLDAALADLDRQWLQRVGTLGLPGMPLSAFEDWRAARDHALAAAEAADQAGADLALQTEVAAAATTRLATALMACGETAPPDGELDALIETARARVDTATARQAHRRALQSQHDDATRALGDLADALAQARTIRAEWQQAWADNVRRAGLPERTEVGAAEGALKLFVAIDEHLNDIRKLRKTRIATMQRDLDDLAQTAGALAGTLAPELAGQPPAEIAALLSNRLAQAHDERKESVRLAAELQRFSADLVQAEEQLERAGARIAPLMQLAGVTTRQALREAIGRSDERRLIAQAVRDARQAAESGGDGLPLDALCDEVAGADLAQVAIRLGELRQELESVSDQLNQCTAQLTTARAERDRIAGQDDAARAAAARQEALAGMADAAERFIKVHIGARLLRWAIDRYRETRQGPLLERASEIFAGLTLGSFVRLVVDFESDPPTLDGMRPGGATVGITGMSDGTRDQLYLALRLAALEMHIGQAHALPFLADDLFINYDDGRSAAGLAALAALSERTQVLFMTHHEHLVPVVQSVFGEAVNIVTV